MEPSALDSTGPVSPFSDYPNFSAGEPVTINVGRDYHLTRFDIHHDLLTSASPVFATPTGRLRKITRPINLPKSSPILFPIIWKWLYERTPPAYVQPYHIDITVRLWVQLGKLGMWEMQNTLLQMASAFVQPKEFMCNFTTVQWVYISTDPGSKLRDFVIALFCQRPVITEEVFVRHNRAMVRDAVKFMRVLNKVRARNPRGKDGYDVKQHLPIVYTSQPGDGAEKQGNMMRTLVHGDNKVDWSKIEYPLPSFLVWGEKWEDMPDKHFFVDAESTLEAAKELRKLLDSM